MKNFKRNTLATLAPLGVALALLSGCSLTPSASQSAKTYSEEELGLRQVALMNEDKIVIEGFEYGKDPAGTSKMIERAFENAPPMIPHDVTDMLPITKDLNMCTSCHLPEVAESVAATAMPKSHFFNLRTGEDLQGMMDEARYNCSACHTPQANLAPLVHNRFQPEFRGEGDKNRSNLLDTLNEGVK